MTKKLYLRTFGCQMNEHDSERISGLLEADGLVRVDDEADADVIVFNTCTIRENADNRLYGNLSHLVPVKAAHPGMQIAVGGCLAQKDQGTILANNAGPLVLDSALYNTGWVTAVTGNLAVTGVFRVRARMS